MSALPPAPNPLVPGIVYHGLLPIRFGLKAYLDFCHQFDRVLADLEARYPGRPRVLTLAARNKKMVKRRPK
ncbi:MAG: hypothetical protein L0228_22120 [Planctomycetes bacterium]|nr:hypothetical protein [Planctomycetota bacterium]